MALARPIVFGAALAAVLSASTLALAADYYFDSVGGDDGKDGTTEATAKKTLAAKSGNTMHLKRGSSWTMSNLNLSNVTLTTYGTGARPEIIGSVMVSGSTVQGLAVRPTTGNGFNVQSNNTIRDCEVDGTVCTASIVGFGVMGENNHIIGNYVHDLSVSQSGGSMNNSGGAEGFMVMASNNEVAFNSAVNCQSVNTTLGGFEGGCLEIVNGKAGSTITNVSFHHNYCEKSVGLWEGCSGDFSSTGGGIQTNHGIIENVTVSYNVSVDSMWLFLLQPVNTDFRNVVFANNTIIHTPKSAQYWDSGGGHFMMALAVDTDTVDGTTYTTENQWYTMSGGFQPGTIIVRNNIFVDDISSSRNMMFMTKVADHSHNVFVPSTAQPGSITLGSTEKKVDLATLAFTADYRLTASSTPAIDQGTTIDMNTAAGMAGTAVNASMFQSAFNQDIDERAVPCGSAPDIGASEYCSGAGGTPGSGGTSNGGSSTTSTGGTSTPSSGGRSAPGTGGSTPNPTGGSATNPTGGAGGGSSSPENCNCRTAGDPSGPTRGPIALLALFGAMLLTRRQRSRTG